MLVFVHINVLGIVDISFLRVNELEIHCLDHNVECLLIGRQSRAGLF
jgi:hypothetical protein